MSRNKRAAEAAAAAASEAAKTLAARSHEARQEPKEEPKAEAQPTVNPDRVEKLLKGRPHSQAMDEILSKREVEPEPEEPEKKAEEAAPEPVEAKKEPEAPTTITEEPKAPEAPKTVRVKVDGEEFDAPEEEVESYGGIKAYQIAKAHENRLKKANEAVAESKRLTAQLVELLQRKQEPETPKVTDDEFIKSKVDIIRFGTPEESATALREVLARQAPKQDQGQLVGLALAAVQKQQAVDAFKKEHQDIMANPLLLKLAIALETEEVANASKSGQPIDWRNLYGKIANQVRSVAPRPSQPTATQQTPGTPSSASEKEARKASITVLPTSSARAEAPKEEKELTPEEERKAWIAEQKKARGLG